MTSHKLVVPLFRFYGIALYDNALWEGGENIMELFGGIKNFATQIGNVGQKAQEFGSRSLASHGLSDALVMKYAQDNEKGLLDRASFSAFGGGGGGSWRGSASLANFPKYRARQISEFGINILKDAPSALVNLAEAGTSKVAQGLSQTTFGKYAQGNKDGLIDQALLGLAFGPAALALGPKQSEQIFASVGEKVADPMSRLYHNDVFQAVGSALNQGSGLFSTLSILPDPVGAMFGAANIATEALYGVFLSTGTFDGSVSTSDALAPAKQASERLAQIELSKYSEKFSGKLNKISGKDKGHKEIGVSQSLKQLRSGGIKKFIGGGTHNILKNYLGRLTGLGIHYARIAKRHNVVKGILDFLTLSHEVYDKYDKLSKTKIGHSFINSSFEHGKSAGQWLDYKAHNASHFLLNHRAQIGDTLHKTSSILGGASAGLGIVAAGLALTGIGAPAAAVLGTVSLSLAAASAAVQAWYAVTKSVGTIDGSVSTGEANHAAAQAATNLALTLVSVEVASAQAVAKAKTMLETKNALSFLHSNPRAVLQLDKATKFLNKLPGVNLGRIFRDAALVKRLKIGSLALKVAQIPATIASMGGLHGILHTWHTVENKALGLGHRGKALALTALHAGRQAFQKIGHGGLHLLQSAGRGLTNAGHTVLGKITDLRSLAAHLAARAQMWARQGVHRGEAALLTGLAAALQGSHALTATANGFLQRSGGQMLHGIAHAFTESLSHNLSTAQTVLGFLEGGGHPEQIGSALYEITQNLHGVTHGVGGLFSTVFGEKQHSAGPVHLPLRPVMPSFAGSPLSSMGHLPAIAFAGMPGHHTGAAPFSPLFPLFNSHSSSHSPLSGSLSGFIGRTASAVSGTAHHMPSLLPSLMPGHGILPKRTAGFARPAVHMAQSLSSTGSHGHPPTAGSHGHSSTAAPVLSAIHHFLPSLKLPVPSAILPAFAVHPFAGLQTAEHHVKQMGHQALSHMPGIPGALGHMMHGFGRFLQRKGSGDHPDVHPAALRDDLRKQSSGFVPDSNVRAKLGGHLGFDPGGARLHTGPAAASASRALNAEAFTIGSDVFFGDGRFDPHTPKGLGLIAHELTHVGQQTGTTGNKARFFTAQGGDEMEREAQQTGERVLANAGSRAGFFVEDYVREYEGEYNLSQSDQQRLDRISVKALEESQRMLERQGLRGLHADALDVQVEIDLSEMSDGEAVRVWAEAICIQISNSQKAMSNSQPNSSLVQRTANDGQSALAEPTFLGTLWDSVKSGEVEEQIGAFVKGFGTGVISGIEGLYTLVRHPIKSAKGLYHMVVHYDETKATLKALVDEYVAAAETDPIKFARMTGELTGQIEVALITPGKVIQGGKSIAEFLTPASETLGKVGTAAKFDPLVSSLPKQLSKLTNAELESTARLPDEVGAFAGERLLSFTTKKMFLVRVGPFGRYGADLFDSLEEAQAYADRLSVLDAEAIRDKFALLTEWNKVDAVRIFEVPSGTPYLGGEIAAQVEKGSGILYHGGGYQVAIGPEQKLNQVGDAIAVTGTSPTTPVGSMRNPLRVVPGSEAARNIGNRYFTGPALEGMHSNGIPSTVVEDAIATGQQEAGSLPGTTRYYQPTNNVSVVVDTKTQNVVEVHPGIASNSNLKLNRSTLAGHDPDTGAAEQEAQITEASVTKDINRKYSSSNAIGQTRQGMGIGLIQRKVISLKSPFGSLQNFVSSHSGRPNLTTPSIDVRATHIGGSGIVGALLSRMPIWHLFIVTTNEAGQQRFYRGGPGGPGKGPYGTIKSTHGPYVPGTVDWNPSAPSKSVSKGNDAKNKDSVRTSELQRIDGLGVNYEPLGPNSNTVASTLLRKCDIPRLKPVWLAPGWDKPDL